MERRTYKTNMRNEDGKIEGIASSVNSRYDLGWFEEEIAAGAFDDALGDDVRVLFNHNPDILLGRTSSGTAEISQTTRAILRIVTKHRTRSKERILRNLSGEAM